MDWHILGKTALIYSVVTIYLGRLRRPRIRRLQFFDCLANQKLVFWNLKTIDSYRSQLLKRTLNNLQANKWKIYKSCLNLRTKFFIFFFRGFNLQCPWRKTLEWGPRASAAPLRSLFIQAAKPPELNLVGLSSLKP